MRRPLFGSSQLLFLFMCLHLFLGKHGSIIYVTDGKILAEMILILLDEFHDVAGKILGLGHDVWLVHTLQEQLRLQTIEGGVEALVADLVGAEDFPHFLQGAICGRDSQRPRVVNGDQACLGVWARVLLRMRRL
jgi:hypothetical protein